MTKSEFLNIGLKYFSEKKHHEAIEHFKAALNIDSRFDLAYNALAECYRQLGDLDKAIEMAQTYRDLYPNDPIARAALSRLYQENGMIEEAEQELSISNQLTTQNRNINK